METEQIRIQKFISDCGIMSRRAAEREIELGHVTVNDVNANLGDKIIPGKDTVKLCGKVIGKNSDKKRYIMLNKPVGYLTSMSDDRGRKCVSELVADVGARVYPCGRLDMASEGLLILTNDGEFANILTHPHNGHIKTYNVKIKGEVTADIIKALSEPMIIDDYEIKPVKVWLVSSKRDYTILGFGLSEGRNRQIRKMCEKFSLEVLSLRRIAIDDVMLGKLPLGEWRDLSKYEVNLLKKGSK